METFGTYPGGWIADERRRAGLSQEALAARCKFHPTTSASWSAG
jgi:ribosome-binding protein aMBF1 (putative translation factor)